MVKKNDESQNDACNENESMLTYKNLKFYIIIIQKL